MPDGILTIVFGLSVRTVGETLRSEDRVFYRIIVDGSTINEYEDLPVIEDRMTGDLTHYSTQHYKSNDIRTLMVKRIMSTDGTSLSAGQILDHATTAFRSESLKLEPVGLKTLMLDSIQRLAPIADMKSIDLKFDPSLAKPVCRADAVLLQHAIGNILDNVIKYSPADSVVRRTVEKPVCNSRYRFVTRAEVSTNSSRIS